MPGTFEAGVGLEGEHEVEGGNIVAVVVLGQADKEAEKMSA
jgi:hypothetical protein